MPSKNIDAHTTRLTQEKIFSKESCLKLVLLIIPVRLPRDRNDEIAELIRKVPGTQALTEVTVEGKKIFTPLYASFCSRVGAYPVIFK